ncbi:MAG: cytochrome c3 family protein [Planctomycetota bacterium]
MKAVARVFTLVLALAAAATAQEASCVTHCHGKESTEFKGGVHSAVLACVDCHGGNAAAQRDKERSHATGAGFRGAIPRESVPELCGGCHSDLLRMRPYALPTDQLAHYRDSNHGQALLSKGGADTAVCTDCHGAHGILSGKDPTAPTARANQPATCGRCHSDQALMERHGLPADTVERFRNSVHGRALMEEQARGAPACADCHGSHGAAPPGVREIVQVCGHCHESTREGYRKSIHYSSQEMSCAACHEEKSADYDRSGCTACHGAHEIARPGTWMYTGDDVGHCGHCHREEGDRSNDVANSILDGRAHLEDAMEETLRDLKGAKEVGLFLENENVYLLESRRALVSVQPLFHSLDARAIARHLEDGLKRQDRTREMIVKKRKILRDRRLLLTGLAALLVLLAGLLAVKLKNIRRLS